MTSFLTSDILKDVGATQKFNENKLLDYLRRQINVFPSTGSLKVSILGNSTYYLQCNKFKAVLKTKQSIKSLQNEYTIMYALQNNFQNVPVPKMYHLCTNSSIIGQPFYICEFIQGRVYKKRDLPKLKFQERYCIYHEINAVLSAIHSVNLSQTKFNKFSNSASNKEFAQIIDTTNKQLKVNNANSIDSVNQFTNKINEYNNHKRKDSKTFSSLVHGNFRLENIIFDAKSLRILAVLGWNSAAIGNQLTDLSNFCYETYHSVQPVQTDNTGIPDELNFIQSYINLLDTKTNAEFIAKFDFPIKDWSFYLSVSVFQNIAITTNQKNFSFFSVTQMGRKGMRILNETNIYDKILLDTNTKLPYYYEQYRAHFDNPNFFKIRQTLLYFVTAYIKPAHKKWNLFYQNPRNKWTKWPGLEKLKDKAKELNLWNLFLPEEYTESAAHLTNLQYVPLAEIMGTAGLTSVACNCAAPDTGNMEVLAKYGSKYQKDKWLIPLMEGKIRSCFGMTEPFVSSSDARNIECSMVKTSDGKHYIINGRKWWSSGGNSPDCKICILMGKTDPTASTYFQQSMFVVELDRPGVKVTRHLKVFGYDHSPAGHAEIIYDNVKVPVENLILGEGKGFEIAQGRLGPGRIHHCMRTIGTCEVALKLMKRRCLTRYAFGKHLYKFQSLQHDIAEARVDINMLRLLVLQAAFLMDTIGAKNRLTRQNISMIKVKAANIACKIVDNALQAFGGRGVMQDTPLAHMYAGVRTLRLADGADAVHQLVVARNELLQAKL